MSKNFIISVWIISPSGGLIYKKDIAGQSTLARGNDPLELGSLFHSQYAISSALSPLPGTSSGIESVETDDFRIQCLRTPTGILFFVLAEPHATNLERTLKELYELFADYVGKNPFYVPNQPIKSALFDKKILESPFI
ncbi:putative Trafficking protein particle complex subunit 4 [Blattamonas nauphoetae]|uniref:Trafficking protein particle complex subunit n=1 Tax=Blattamonas nauphoetae TaxID=2049346 RepID=A0ABQ9XGK9_9EUKA|nr:putative Trafficking protein particle complex subunit 4 [Blattamonas nauphoetae]